MAIDATKVTEILQAAQKAVAAADIPEELREAAFSKAVDLLASGAPQQEAQEGERERRGQDGHERGQPSLARTAGTLGLELETVQQIYLDEEGQLQVIVPSNRLAGQARPAMRELILLTAAGRQAGGWDTGTTAITEARVVCEHYGGRHYDSNNFGNAARDLRDYVRMTGSRNNATLRVLPGGFTEAANLVRRLADEE